MVVEFKVNSESLGEKGENDTCFKTNSNKTLKVVDCDLLGGESGLENSPLLHPASRSAFVHCMVFLFLAYF